MAATELLRIRINVQEFRKLARIAVIFCNFTPYIPDYLETGSNPAL